MHSSSSSRSHRRVVVWIAQLMPYGCQWLRPDKTCEDVASATRDWVACVSQPTKVREHLAALRTDDGAWAVLVVIGEGAVKVECGPSPEEAFGFFASFVAPFVAFADALTLAALMATLAAAAWLRE